MIEILHFRSCSIYIPTQAPFFSDHRSGTQLLPPFWWPHTLAKLKGARVGGQLENEVAQSWIIVHQLKRPSFQTIGVVHSFCHLFGGHIPVLPISANGYSLPGYENIRNQALCGMFASCKSAAFLVRCGKA